MSHIVSASLRLVSLATLISITDPEPIPRGTDYASVIESDVPLIVRHTRLDSRQAENALLSTIAYANRNETL